MPRSKASIVPMVARALRPLRPTPSSRVAVGIPVRDGAAFLELALRSVVGQTHKNLDIIISDNASSDATAVICKRFAREDPRIRYIRQPTVLRADDNFRFVFEQCDSDWFMWASHDDLRDLNYIEVLLSGFASHPNAALMYTDTEVFSDHSRQLDGVRRGEVFPSADLPFPERHAAVVQNGAVQIYGLFRAEVLRTFRWPAVPAGHDWMILHWSVTFGDLTYVPGSTFRYFVPARPVRSEGSGAYHWLKGKSWLDRVRMLPDVRWAIHASRELAYARRSQGLETDLGAVLQMLVFLHHGGPKEWAKQFVYLNAPSSTRAAWRALRDRSRA